MVRPIRAVAALLLVPLAAGCTGTPSGPATPGPAADKVSGEVSAYGCTPAYSLLASDAVERCGAQVLDAVTSRLFHVDTATGAVEKDLAESVDTSDSQTFTVHLAKGRKFSDGTEIRARNFVAAWNWAAYGPNGSPAQSYFSPIEGAKQLACGLGTQCSMDGRPASLSGLKVLDDHTFTIRTTKPSTDLSARLSHPVFAPLPDSFFAEDADKPMSRKLPTSSGPFKVTMNTNAEIRLERFDDYAGRWPAQVRKVTLRIYDAKKPEQEFERSYDDLVAGRLDVSAVIPTDQLTDDQWRKDLKDRTAVLETQLPQALTFSMSDGRLRDPRVRRALSMAVDREALARQVFNGTRKAATDWVSPGVPDFRAGACGQTCTYDPAEARELMQQAGGFTGELKITVNSDGGNKQWADALCNQFKNVHNLDCQVDALKTAAQLQQQAGEKQTGSLFLQEWGPGYRSAEPYLSRYQSRSRVNLGQYSNTEFDNRLEAAAGATSQADATAAYARADGVLAQDPPSIPLWTTNTPVGWSSRISGVQVNQLGGLDLSSIRMA